MKKHSIAIPTAILLALIINSPAMAEDNGFYLTPKAGFSLLGTKVDSNITNGNNIFNNPFNGSYSKGAFLAALAFGYDFKPNFDVPIRTELEYSWRGKTQMYEKNFDANSKETVKTGAQSIFVNTYWDYHNSSDATPYLGLGLGFGMPSIEHKFTDGAETETFSKSKAAFAWNIGLGVAYKMNDLFSLDFGYRYANFGKIEHTVTDGEETIKLNQKVHGHDFLLGGRFTF